MPIKSVKLLLLLLPGVWLLLAMACHRAPAAQHQQPSVPLLLFQKTPCLGTCPAYNATIHSDGSVQFVAFERALAQDTLHLQLSTGELDTLHFKIEQLNYNELDNSYLTAWSDMPATYTTFYENGKQTKRIKHEEGGPETLRNFQNWLHRLLEQKRLPTH